MAFFSQYSLSISRVGQAMGYLLKRFVQREEDCLLKRFVQLQVVVKHCLAQHYFRLSFSRMGLKFRVIVNAQGIQPEVLLVRCHREECNTP